MDGVAIGMLVDKLRDEKNPLLPFISEEILNAPEFKERMFVKLKKNRILLQNVFNSTGKLLSLTKKDLTNDPNMVKIQNYLLGIKNDGYTAYEQFYDLLTDISSVSSTTSIFQVIDEGLLEDFKKNLLNKQSQIMKDSDSLKLKNKIYRVYPLIYKRMKNISNLPILDGKLPVYVKDLINDLIDFVLTFYKSLPKRNKSEVFTKRTEGENKFEIFPQWNLLWERPRYEADEKNSSKDKDAFGNLCSKLFPEHRVLTPGLFVVTCCCPQKNIYGIKKMIQGESPRIIFDLINCRFDEDYNPKIIYDASCRLKEFGLNREPKRIMDILVAM